MHIHFYGTRGSSPVFNRNIVKTGGNTTCLRIESQCLPDGHWLIVDSGTGIMPLGVDFIEDNGKEASIIYTHRHHDHTLGLLTSAFPYLKHVPLNLYGPKEHDVGGRQAIETLMQPPYFPVDFAEKGCHFNFFDIERPNSTILVIHPTGGRKTFKVEEFERLTDSGKQLPFKDSKKFPVAECLVIRMHRSNHPEQTISYRFEERPTGQVFIFVTDHENQDGIPQDFLKYLEGANLLVMDSQYDRKTYDDKTAGFGHGTPDHAARVANKTQVPYLGLTHHDPFALDDDVDAIVATAQELADSAYVFACCDYMKVDIGNLEELKQ